jgi:hypothetical protein
MEDLSQRRPPTLSTKAEDTAPGGLNGVLVWSSSDGRLITYNQSAGRWVPVGVYPALGSVTIPGVVYNTFLEMISTTTLALTANNQYFLPFYVPVYRSIQSLGFEVTTAASSGTAAVGIYNTQIVSGIAMPNQLLASITGMTITTTGIKTATGSSSPLITLRTGVLYWASIYVTAGVTVRACVSPTRMLLSTFTSPLVSVRISNSSGNLIDPAPTSGYTGNTSAPILVYT